MVELKRKVTLKTKSAMPDDIADEVHLKRKVTIREKHEEPDNSGNPNDGGNENPPTTETPKGKKWFLWLIIIAIIMIGGYLWYSQNGKSGSEPIAADSTQVEKTDSAKTASTDSVVSTTSGSDNNGSKGSNGNSASTSQKNQEKNEVGEQKGYTPTSSNETAVPSSDEKPSINAESETSTTSVEETARDVIKGIYGNGNVRKDRLGSRYQTVQDRVNEMYRQGLVH